MTESGAPQPERQVKSFAIIPAAGRSRRMGRPKLLLPWQETTVVEHVLAAWSTAGVTRRVVVVHPEDRQLAQRCRDAGADVVVPDLPPADMRQSVALALDHVAKHFSPRQDDVWLLAPADMPRLTAAAISRLLAARAAYPHQIVRATCAGRRGHPVLFPWPFASEVAALPADEGISGLVRRGPVVDMEVDDEGILGDLDTPDDYRQLLGQPE